MECGECHQKAPGLVFFLDGPEDILLELHGEDTAWLRTLLAESFAEEDLTAVGSGAPSLSASCAFGIEEVLDPILVPASTGKRLYRGEVRVRLSRGGLLLGEKVIPSRVQVTDDPARARSTILDRLAIDAFRFICGRLEEE